MNGPRIVVAATLVLIAFFAGVVALHGTDEAGLRTLVRATARMSFAVFLPVYAASSLRRLFPADSTRWLLRNRRYLGLSFFVAHMLHLAAIGMLSLLLGDAFVVAPSTLLFGGIAYALLVAMALTSSDRAVARLGPRRWGLLHRIGIHWLWFVFAYDWVVLSVFDPAYTPLALLSFAALGLRIAARRRVRSGGSPAVPARAAPS